MNKKNILIFISLIAIVVAIILVYEVGTNISNNNKCEEYTQILAGHSYYGSDSTTTANHGKVRYSYTMKLNEDGSCNIHFRATRTGDKSTFAENGTTEFDLTGLTWDVREEDGYFKIYIGGETDWQDWSAAEISRTLEIIDAEGEDIIFKAIRSKYYEFYFRQSKY